MNIKSTEYANYLIPIWSITRDKPARYRLMLMDQLSHRYQLITAEENPQIRQLLAKDLGLRSWETPSQHKGESSVWIQYTVPVGKIIIIGGITELSKNPKVSSLVISKGPIGNVIIGIHDIDELYSILPVLHVLKKEEDKGPFSQISNLERLRMTGFFSQPYLYDQQEIIHISVESLTQNKNGDRLMLNGFIAERRGLTIV